MALVKCPECGKENVSSTATACPQCGFNIKKYYEDIEKEKKVEKIQKDVKEIPSQAKKINIGIFKSHKKVFIPIICALLIVISLFIKLGFFNNEYPITLGDKTISLGDSKKHIKNKMGNKYLEFYNSYLLKDSNNDNDCAELYFDKSDKLVKILPSESSKLKICGITIGDSSHKVQKKLDLKNFDVNIFTKSIMVYFDQGRAKKVCYLDFIDDSYENTVKEDLKKYDAILMLDFYEEKVTNITLGESSDFLKTMN